jgi:predicted nucleic acid binding AN1-type Zn finger protein
MYGDASITDSCVVVSSKMLPNKIRCSHGGCKRRAAVVIGDCRYCKSTFCLHHRLPETHACSEIDACKKLALHRNTRVLMESKCVGSKVRSLD